MAPKRAPKLDYLERDLYRMLEEGLAAVGVTLIYHTHDSRRSHAGYPDYTVVDLLARPLFAEVKREGAEVTQEQLAWLMAFGRSSPTFVLAGPDAVLAFVTAVGHRETPTPDRVVGVVNVLGEVRIEGENASDDRPGAASRSAAGPRPPR